MKTVESLTAQRDVQGAILHSDQGFQYTTHIKSDLKPLV
ncbi:hypothetical protein SC09_Contig19orf01236 [Bacillus subtilis]|nr:hypothetical protein SC09_Contig19orf01236 [Bacillus subtilis]